MLKQEVIDGVHYLGGYPLLPCKTDAEIAIDHKDDLPFDVGFNIGQASQHLATARRRIEMAVKRYPDRLGLGEVYWKKHPWQELDAELKLLDRAIGKLSNERGQ